MFIRPQLVRSWVTAAHTVRQCLQQRCACRSTSCGTTQTGSVWNPEMRRLSFKRIQSSSTQRKGGCRLNPHSTLIIIILLTDWVLYSYSLWIQAHGEQSSLSGVLQGEKDPRGVRSLSKRRAGPPEEWEETAQPQPANIPVTASPGTVPAVAVSEHVIWCRWQWKRGRQPSPSFPWWRPRANATQWAYIASFKTDYIFSRCVFIVWVDPVFFSLLIKDGNRKRLRNSLESNHLYLERLDWKVKINKKFLLLHRH